ncbi:helix-turn-helix domain-containing protein [Cohnella zeiphila]|uniref:Helix-turn-helix domain-containing protein n=1 Tax=Cohnella zeiphila TaxID=2761120 RepID=A0A7X0SNI3_9BACL|nr:helix-turn-helix domain-containing protein [Cohnella zeiphila]MBB6733273.1 helix-turn-helix domain-containing protein [Cohnella zeiphila]
MKKSWYKRMLFSYAKALYTTISIILLLSCFVISEVSFRGTEKANRVSASYVSDSIEQSLKEAERVVLVQLEDNQAFQDFFEPSSSSNSRLINYEASSEIRQIMKDVPVIYSICLYRASDNSVLTQDRYQQLPFFSDHEFMSQSIRSAPEDHWSEARFYPEYLNGGKDKKVISIVKKAPIPLGSQGVVVINVSLDSLLSVANDMINPDIMFMVIHSGDQTMMYPSRKSLPNQRDILTRIDSPYASMQFESGITGGWFFKWMHVISRGWVALGVAAILFSLMSLVYITRRNYRPIEQILGQIQTWVGKNESKGTEDDEFAFISTVLENVIDQNLSYEKQSRQDLPVRRKQFFMDLIAGDPSLTESALRANLSKFNISLSKESAETLPIRSAIVEMDGYLDFQAKYNTKDQNLLRFSLTNVLHEFFDRHHYTLWPEWIEANRLTVLLVSHSPDQADQEIWEKFRTWVAVHLRFSVTLGIGGQANSWREIPASFAQAAMALHYKCSLGMNRLIRHEELSARQSGDLSRYYARIGSIIDEFRMFKSDWEAQLDELFRHLETDLFNKEEIRHLFVFMLRSFQRMIDTMPEEIREYWQSAQVNLTELMELETLEAMLPPLSSSLKRMLKFSIDYRQANANRQLLSEIRNYIEDHYDSPDLSLDHIGDKFRINGKYSSQLFKQQFGMTFVDFLINLRMDHAKRMLLDTEDSINDIALKVGYLHPISFGRAFKRATGVTPSDYRKYMRNPDIEESAE